MKRVQNVTLKILELLIKFTQRTLLSNSNIYLLLASRNFVVWLLLLEITHTSDFYIAIIPQFGYKKNIWGYSDIAPNLLRYSLIYYGPCFRKRHLLVSSSSKLTFTCSKSTTETLKKGDICSVYNKDSRTQQNGVNDVNLPPFLLNLNIFHTFFYYFYCWLWTCKCLLGYFYPKIFHVESFSISL